MIKTSFLLIFLILWASLFSPTLLIIPDDKNLSSYNVMLIGYSWSLISSNLSMIFNQTDNITAPTLISPENACAIEEFCPITFRWTDVTKAENYTLQIDTSKYFNSSNLIEIRDINDTEYMLEEGLPFGNWYWRICAIFENGQRACSEMRNIIVVFPAPSLIFPENACTVEINHSTTFRWTSVNGAKSYILQIDTTKYFNSSVLIEVRGINDTKYTLEEGLQFGDWYWRVCAVFNNGYIACSEIRLIIAAPRPDAIELPFWYFPFILGWGYAILILICFFAYSWVIDHYYGKNVKRNKK